MAAPKVGDRVRIPAREGVVAGVTVTGWLAVDHDDGHNGYPYPPELAVEILLPPEASS